MTQHHKVHLPDSDTQSLGRLASPIYTAAFIAGAVGLVLALLGAMFAEDGIRRFAFSYVIAFAFVLSLSLGSMLFVLIQFMWRAGWSVVVRRPAEVLAANIPTVAVLFAPILVFVILNNGELYPWAQPLDQIASHHEAEDAGHGQLDADVSIITVANEHDTHAEHGDAHADHSDHAADAHAEAGHHDDHAAEELHHFVEAKRAYLNIPFFLIRWVAYFVIWAGIGLFYFRNSTQQDTTGDVSLTHKMEKFSPALTLLFGVTITLAAFDLLMSLDPKWFSTIFGVYYFAGSFLASMAALILITMGLQRWGFFQSVTVEHHHDLGKLLFAFVFFWGYIAFSQYMLIWYANLPETTYWFDLRGMTTVAENQSGWTWVALILLFGHLLIPFAGLLSRHVKRSRKALVFWAIWLLIFHWIDLYWVAMPIARRTAMPGIIELGTLVGVLGIFIGSAVRLAANHSLVPTKDPRLSESLGFHNI